VSVLRSDVADLEEPCTRSKRESHEGWIAGPGKAALMEKSQSCSVVVLFSEPALEEPFTASEGG
jgi:hypothetical protein